MTTRRKFLGCAAGISAAACLPGACFADKTKNSPAHPARFWHPFGEMAACDLCPHRCIIDTDKTALCRTRRNVNGALVTHAYANPCTVNVDPVEKKPFYHVLPAARAFSLAIAGCNLRCLNCQNYTISQESPLDIPSQYLPPEQVVSTARAQGCAAIAYTYTEPTVWFEYMYDTAKLARAAGLKNLWVTSGYICDEPLKELSGVMDAATIDLKSFDDAVYQKLNAGTLKPVLDTIIAAKKFGMWVEVSNLVVPEWSDNLDSIRNLSVWIKRNVGADVPLHFLRFYPLYKLARLYPTPAETLLSARKIALAEGLNYVYVGNVAEADNNSYCARCKKIVIERDGYLIKQNNLIRGKCKFCNASIPGLWNL